MLLCILMNSRITLSCSDDHKLKFYWGHKEILIPVYKNMSDAMERHKHADTLVNFASLRSAEESTIEAMQYPQIRTIAIIAEGLTIFLSPGV